MNPFPRPGFLAFFVILAVTYSCTKVYAPEYENNIENAGDYQWDSSGEVNIALDGSSATVKGKGVTVKGGEVLITSGGNYRISGTLNNGRIVVNYPGDSIVRLILDGVAVTGNTNAAIFIRDAGKTIVYLEEGSVNSLTDAVSYVFDDVAGSEPAAALYSKSYLSICGNGTLNVNGRFLDGIVGKDGLVIRSGSVSVNAVDDGIRGKDYLLIHDGDISVTSGDDALKSDVSIVVEAGTLHIASGDDAIHADSSLAINGGCIDITRSYEGLESIALSINGGNIHLVSSDDGINAADGTGGGQPGMPGMPPQGGFTSGSCSLRITGGYTWVNGSGDGIDINGSVEMTAGTLIIDGPTANDNGALDYDGTCKVTGGTILAIGSSGMAQAPGTGSSQNSVMITFSSQQPAGTLVTITDSNGNAVVSAGNSKKFQSVVYCSSNLVKGSSYDIYLAGTNSGTVADGIYQGGQYTPGSKYRSFTVSGIITQVR